MKIDRFEESTETLICPPSPDSLIQSLRGIGYSAKTAIADIIDNSISAGCKNIYIKFTYDYIYILDDGIGMSYEELINAMTIGYMNPLYERSSNDLGRFGLGLKTASFSQCKCLTVFSKKLGLNKNVLCWDLDFLQQNKSPNRNDWAILKYPGTQAKELSSVLDDYDQGTLVVWENLDRIFTDGFKDNKSLYLDLIDDVEQHIAITFHRYLSSKRIKISINNKNILPVDPFFSKNLACLESPIGRLSLRSDDVVIRHFTLPLESQLNDEEKSSLGPNNDLIVHQGFYVYRNDRLILQGGWLDLGDGSKKWAKDECYKYARISIDITNQSDQAWKIDIKKSKANPPAKIREFLIHVGKSAREQSRKLFYLNRKPSFNLKNEYDSSLLLWSGEGEPGKNRKYRLTRKHPLIQNIFSLIPDQSYVEDLLCLIEKTVPVETIFIDNSDKQNEVSESNLNSNIDEDSARLLIKNIVDVFKKSESKESIEYRLCHDPILKDYKAIIEEHIKDL